MSLERLLAGDLAGWLADPPPAFWLFVHVPKTAGSSLTAELSQELTPYVSLHIDHLDRSRPGPVRFDAVVERFLAAQPARPPRFASGHILWRHASRIASERAGTALLTLLRDPVARHVSDYLYQRSAQHPLWREFQSKVPDFAAFLELPGPRNRAARHLLPEAMIRAGDPAAAIAHVRRHFAFVGVQEQYALAVRLLTARLGTARAPTARKRVNEEAAAERAATLAALQDPALRARLLADNAMDVALHRHFAAAWDRAAPALEAALAMQELPSGGA
jgi:hypothetical protein